MWTIVQELVAIFSPSRWAEALMSAKKNLIVSKEFYYKFQSFEACKAARTFKRGLRNYQHHWVLLMKLGVLEKCSGNVDILLRTMTNQKTESYSRWVKQFSCIVCISNCFNSPSVRQACRRSVQLFSCAMSGHSDNFAHLHNQMP